MARKMWLACIGRGSLITAFSFLRRCSFSCHSRWGKMSLVLQNASLRQTGLCTSGQGRMGRRPFSSRCFPRFVRVCLLKVARHTLHIDVSSSGALARFFAFAFHAPTFFPPLTVLSHASHLFPLSCTLCLPQSPASPKLDIPRSTLGVGPGFASSRRCKCCCSVLWFMLSEHSQCTHLALASLDCAALEGSEVPTSRVRRR